MSVSPQQTMTVTAVKPVLRFIEEHGIPLQDALHGTKLSSDELSSLERISIAAFDVLLNNVARATDNDHIGFIAGQRLELQSFNMLGFLISSCQTGRDALVAMRRYYMLLSDSPAPEIFITKNQIKVIYHISAGSEASMRNRAEFIATGIHKLGNGVGGNLYKPLRITFRHKKPPYSELLADYFGIPIEYDQPECSITFDGEHVDTPLEYANPALFHALRSQVDYALARYSKLDATSQRVRHLLEQWPKHIAITKEAVAELMNTSPRTLTRRLQEEDTQFSHLLREVRMSKAQKELQGGGIDMQDLAHSLGFADRRGFERAFKQWSGMTPAAYHKNWRAEREEA